jgi:hypothetical protein
LRPVHIKHEIVNDGDPVGIPEFTAPEGAFGGNVGRLEKGDPLWRKLPRVFLEFYTDSA